MRKIVVLLIIIIIAVAGFTLLYLKIKRPAPTPFDWDATVLTLAGDGSPLFRDVAKAAEAGFSDPFGIAIDGDGTIYIADAGESNRIRKVTSEGTITTLAGGVEGAADGSQASFNSPSGMAIDQDGNLYIADTGNNRIRKVNPEGIVSTVAGSGSAGFVDGPAALAEFNGPVGVGVDEKGNVYIADTYNDRIRKINADGQVVTVAGSGFSGSTDGNATSARFNTPSGVVVLADGSVVVADTGNDALRKISPSGQVTTMQLVFADDPQRTWLSSPVGLAVTHDDFLYVTEFDRGMVVQIAPDGKACVLAGNGSGYADGFAADARFNQPSGIAVDPNTGALAVADSANYLVRKISPGESLSPGQPASVQLPLLTPETLNEKNLLWPVDPQDRPHEVVATMGEVRGSFDSKDSRDHLHSGLDVSGAYGEVVRAIRSEKVTSPVPNWGFDQLSEGLRVSVISYIHIHVGRDKDGNVFNDPRFVQMKGDDGKPTHIRIKRGTRFRIGDAIGTINRMYHVHLIVGPSGGEINPLSLAPIGFKDTVIPTIEKNGIQLFDESGNRLTEMDGGRLVVRGRVSIVVDAFDRSDMNSERRRLGLYTLGYQLFTDHTHAGSKSNPAPAPGFAAPRMTLLFNRLPPDYNATKLAYAAESGITVYGSQSTRFLYQITNSIRDGHVRADFWNTAEMLPGDYVLRIIARDYDGNEAQENRDLRLTIK